MPVTKSNGAGWSEKQLGEILTLNYGWSLPEKNRVVGDTPVYGSNGIVGSHDQALVPSQGIIVGRKGWAGNVHFSRKPFCPIDTTFFVAPSDTQLDIEFLYYLLLHIDLKRILGDVGVPGLNREMAYREQTQFPNDKAEQRKIAAVLGLVQQAMEQQERLLALTAELKKALLHQLFTQGLRHQSQKQTEIGPIPQSWELRSIDELNLDIGDGNYSTKYPRQEEFLSKGVPFLRANNVVDGRLIWNDMRYISPELHAELKKGHTKKDDVCLVTRGNIGEAAFVTDEFVGANMNAQLVRLNGGSHLNGRFLYFALTHPATQKQFKSLKTGTALQQLPIGKLKFVRIPIPSKDEQVEIADSLWLVNEKSSVIERKHAALSALFHTLLHELMTARIRVHNFDLPAIEMAAHD
jgi:type I restriction enzyme S subunit